MDPISLVVTALAAGVAPGLTSVAKESMKDAYDGLKRLVSSKLSDRPEAARLLEPGSLGGEDEHRESELRQALAESGADQDRAIVRAAQEVMQHHDPSGLREGKYDVTIGGVNFHGPAVATVIGNTGSVTQHFGDFHMKGNDK